MCSHAQSKPAKSKCTTCKMVTAESPCIMLQGLHIYLFKVQAACVLAAFIRLQ